MPITEISIAKTGNFTAGCATNIQHSSSLACQRGQHELKLQAIEGHPLSLAGVFICDRFECSRACRFVS